MLFTEPEAPIVRSEAEHTAVAYGIAISQVGEVREHLEIGGREFKLPSTLDIRLAVFEAQILAVDPHARERTRPPF
jgi:hypothetical protein